MHIGKAAGMQTMGHGMTFSLLIASRLRIKVACWSTNIVIVLQARLLKALFQEMWLAFVKVE